MPLCRRSPSSRIRREHIIQSDGRAFVVPRTGTPQHLDDETPSLNIDRANAPLIGGPATLVLPPGIDCRLILREPDLLSEVTDSIHAHIKNTFCVYVSTRFVVIRPTQPVFKYAA